MSYLFDDSSSQSLNRTGVLDPFGISLWFYPDDSAVDCTLYAEYNASRSIYMSLVFAGSTGGDTVQMVVKQNLGAATAIVTSSGTANIDAWNHVYWGRGVNDTTKSYLSLNGESLVTGTWTAAGATTARAIGRTGSIGAFMHMSGRVAEVGLWDANLNENDDRYKGLALGYKPSAIPVDPSGSSGAFGLNLISYSSLIGNPADLVRGESWTVGGSPLIAEHCRRFERYAA